jgi:hypothetical protein
VFPAIGSDDWYNLASVSKYVHGVCHAALARVSGNHPSLVAACRFFGAVTDEGEKVEFLPFAEARAIVRKLKLKIQKEWFAWCKAGKRPPNIPSAPHRTYRDVGWISWPDWLGSRGEHHDPPA